MRPFNRLEETNPSGLWMEAHIRSNGLPLHRVRVFGLVCWFCWFHSSFAVWAFDIKFVQHDPKRVYSERNLKEIHSPSNLRPKQN